MGGEGAGGAERPGVEPRIEHGHLGAGGCDPIPMRLRDAFDEAVESEPAEDPGRGAREIRLRIAGVELRHVIARRKLCGPGRRDKARA